MFRRAHPAGVPDTHGTRSAHLHAVEGTAFAGISDAERGALFDSLTKTLRRSEYHRLRFLDLRMCLDQRRENLPGVVFWDELAECLHFELQAYCGAARMMLDELVYLVARRHGVPPNKARKSPWETADLMKKPVPAECQVPEVVHLRSRLPWFELLNSYRNSFFHHGWRHGSGHYSLTDQRASARNPAANALLVPDKSSLGGRSRPHERTYNDGTTIDEVMSLASRGLDELLRELCEVHWITPEPAPGRLPRAEHPNVFVSLAKPVIFVVHDQLLIPLFSTEAAARAFSLPSAPNVELIDIPVATSVVGRPAVSFSLRGLAPPNLAPSGTAACVRLLLDPVVKDANWNSIECVAHAEVSLAQLQSADTDPVSLPVVNLERVFVWACEDQRDWRP